MIKYTPLKILIIGNSVVGKSSFVYRYINNTFDEQCTTIGIDFSTKTINYKSYEIKIQIWDTSGQERFAPLTTTYFHHVDAVVIMFDMTDYCSFMKISYWLSEAKKNCPENIIMVMAGNKFDAYTKNNNNYNSDIEHFASNNNLKYFSTSAKTGHNINEIFEYIIDKYINNINIKPIPAITITNSRQTFTKKCLTC
jgi:Ras-related protein Rab-5C